MLVEEDVYVVVGFGRFWGCGGCFDLFYWCICCFVGSVVVYWL